MKIWFLLCAKFLKSNLPRAALNNGFETVESLSQTFCSLFWNCWQLSAVILKLLTTFSNYFETTESETADNFQQFQITAESSPVESKIACTICIYGAALNQKFAENRFRIPRH